MNVHVFHFLFIFLACVGSQISRTRLSRSLEQAIIFLESVLAVLDLYTENKCHGLAALTVCVFFSFSFFLCYIA